MQRALIQYRDPKNYDLVTEALRIAGRTDLIGYDKKCLVRPGGTKDYRSKNSSGGSKEEREQTAGLSRKQTKASRQERRKPFAISIKRREGRAYYDDCCSDRSHLRNGERMRHSTVGAV